MKTLLLLALGLLFQTHSLLAQAAPPPATPTGQSAWDEKASTHRVKTTLLADHDQALAGQTIQLGVLHTLDPGWHIYWKNSGDSGLATQIDWSVVDEAGKQVLTSREIRWPAPSVYRQAGDLITTYGYSHEVLLFAPITLPAGLEPGTYQVRAKTNFLTCKVECIPGVVEMTRPLRVGEAPVPGHTALFERWEAKVPTPAKGASVVFSKDRARPGDRLKATVRIPLCPGGSVPCARRPEPQAGKATDAFVPALAPEITWKTTEVVHDEAAREVVVRLQGKVSANRLPATSGAGGVLRLKGGGAWRVWGELQTAAAGVAVVVAQNPQEGRVEPGAAVTEERDREGLGFWGALLGAFLGGLLLNVMPCVLPVLWLKVAGMSEVAGLGRAQSAWRGGMYTAGILSAMGVLAAVVIGVKSVGGEVGWGFQFQNPYFLAALCVALLAFALNLFGVFEFGLVAGADRLNTLANRTREGGRQSFLEGVLCVVLSTPCSAPFMGAAVGFALGAGAWTILGVFGMLGLGLAMPFLLLSVWPGWTRWMPAPGAWLERVKQILGFSLCATIVWVLWVIGQGWGGGGQSRVLGLLWVTALGAWVWGGVQYRGRLKRALGGLMASLAVIGVGVWGLDFGEQEVEWEPFSEVAVAQSLAQGAPAFVDFTADWCITCKVNEHTVLQTEEVKHAVARHGVRMFKADWTRRDEGIRQILRRHGKGGVPMYLVYSPHAPDAPRLLPELLTPGMVSQALAQSAQSR